MPTKVKHGLGMLVVALIAWLTCLALTQVRTTNSLATVLVGIPLLVAGLAFLVGLVGGLVLVAWGLLRD